MPTVNHAGDIARWRLCLGCGACASVCPSHKIELVDVFTEGIRPRLRDTACGTCRDCLAVCPAWENDHRNLAFRPGIDATLFAGFGPVLELWQGHASDPLVRHFGASGGLLTAFALHALQQPDLHGVLHIAADPRDPLRNRTTFSRTRADLLAATGSRYAPASACDSFAALESATGPCVFIGQPSEVTALRKAARLRPTLAYHVALTFSFFSAGAPARSGTAAVLTALGLRPADVRAVRYRGLGWPGRFVAFVVEPWRADRSMSYEQSWGILQAHRPFSTHLCPDGTGEDADLSCGDAWGSTDRTTSEGSSLLLVRTEAGRRFVHQAMKAGAVQLARVGPERLREAQPNLLAKRGAVGARVLALRCLGLPAPRLTGFNLLRAWLRLPFSARLRAFFGTLRRVLARGYRRPAPRALGPLVEPVPSTVPETIAT